MIKKYFTLLAEVLVLPKSTNPDKARKEFILNILLLCILTLTALAFLINVANVLIHPHYEGLNPVITFFILLIFTSLLVVSRKSKISLSGFIFISIMVFLATYAAVIFGVDLPESLLLYSLIIIITGILLDSRYAFVITVCIASIILVLYSMQINHLSIPNYDWKSQRLHRADIFVYIITLAFIMVVSWLSSREIDKSLKRARISEAELQKERDKLEETVEERTAQLKQAQMEKISQLYHFIEFGKVAGGLFHDLMTPLNLVSLNLENIHEESKTSEKTKITNIKKYLRRAIYGTKRLEIFISIARKQLNDSSQLQRFSLSEEVDHVVKLFRYNLQMAKVIIQYKRSEEIEYFGNPLKFNQIVTNLLSNAIDSFAKKNGKTKKIIIVHLYKNKKKVYLRISDNGAGMSENDIAKIFEPFFTTKEQSQHMGLGLYLIKEIVQKDFQGEISLKSKIAEGTTFTVSFQLP